MMNILDTISEIIVADDFYNPAHKIIYQAIIDLGQKHKRIDIVTLQDELNKQRSARCYWWYYLSCLRLQEDIPSVGLIVQHATYY